MKTIEIEELLSNKDIIPIDVRSPLEYQEDTIPGAINIPLLDNLERKKIGTIYHQEGSTSARRLALKLVAPKLDQIVEKIMETGAGRTVAVFCWRGGLRSYSIMQILGLMNYPARQLVGGYKAYRKFIHQFLTIKKLPMKVIVLYGLTGTGKTEIINELQLRKLPAIDLEGLAGHRGSVFGNVGLPQQPSQKLFESMLYVRLTNFWQQKFLIVEGESRRIGKLYLPECLFSAMKEGIHFLVFDQLQSRVKRIINEYTYQDLEQNKSELQEAIFCLLKRIGKEQVVRLQKLVDKGDFNNVVEYLLVNYYDVLYNHPDRPDNRYSLSIWGGNISKAADQINDYLTNNGLGG